MKIRILFRPKIILALLLALLLTAIVMNAFSLYFFTRLDHIVHSDLYRYGLQFSYQWAGQYWTYAGLMIGSIAMTMLVTAISIASILIHTQTSSSGSRSVSCLLLIVGIVMTGLSAFCFGRLDHIVHSDLYRYGLQFSYQWAEEYWTYAKLVLGLLGSATVTTIVPIALILASTPTHEIQLLSQARALIKIQPAKLICFFLLSVGAIAVAFSINYNSSVLAFIGLGLVFWGALLVYITPTKHIRLEVLNATVSSALTDIEKIIVDSGLNTKGIYLPPKYLEDYESGLIFIPKKAEQIPPKLEGLKEEKLYSKNPNGLFLTPPGLALSKLFEKELGTSFTKTDLKYLKEMLPRLFIEDMEIAENIDVSTENSTISIEITNHIFKDICEETKRHPKLYESIGCPLCSAVACALAKATGKPITIEKEEQSQDGKTTKIQYRILEV
jgi:hypothetical protein